MSGTVERAACDWCHDPARPRSSLRRLRVPGRPAQLICRDPVACYRRFRSWMLQEGHWALTSGNRLYSTGK